MQFFSVTMFVVIVAIVASASAVPTGNTLQLNMNCFSVSVLAAIVASASASAIPTGSTFTQRGCSIFGIYPLKFTHVDRTDSICCKECVVALAPSIVECLPAVVAKGASQL